MQGPQPWGRTAGLNPHAAVFVPRWRIQDASTLPTLAPRQTELQEDTLLLTDLPSEVQAAHWHAATVTAAQVFLSADIDHHMQVLAGIFSWLPSTRDVAACSCTGKRLRSIGCDAPLQLVISGGSARVRPAAGEESDRLRRTLQGIAAVYQGRSQHRVSIRRVV